MSEITNQIAALELVRVTIGDPQAAVQYGAAHGPLAMTTAGGTSVATKQEVERLVQGGSARIVR